MYTFAYDETSGFEPFLNGGNEPAFLGGFVYRDFDRKGNSEKLYRNKNNNRLIEAERERIRFFLKAVCRSCGAAFPRDLHADGANSQKVKKIKNVKGLFIIKQQILTFHLKMFQETIC